MSDQREMIWAILQKTGVVQGDKPESKDPDSPWYVKVLLGFSGWLAAIFIIGFLAAGFEFIFRETSILIFLGIVLIAGAFCLLSISKTEFIEHLGLATSLAGQILLVYAMFEITGHNNVLVVWILLTLLQIVLIVLMPNFVHRVFSSFVAAVAFSMTFIEMEMPSIVSGVVMLIASLSWLNEFSYPKHIKKIRAVGYGLTMALILIKGVTLFGFSSFGYFLNEKDNVLWTQPWIGEVFIGVITIFMVWSLLQRYGHTLYEHTTLILLIAAIFICVVSIKVQGITVGIAIMLLGFSASNRVLLSLGIMSLLFYISTYYYLLDITLLKKSQILLVVGVSLLIIRWLMQRVMPVQEEAHHGE